MNEQKKKETDKKNKLEFLLEKSLCRAAGEEEGKKTVEQPPAVGAGKGRMFDHAGKNIYCLMSQVRGVSARFRFIFGVTLQRPIGFSFLRFTLLKLLFTLLRRKLLSSARSISQKREKQRVLH